MDANGFEYWEHDDAPFCILDLDTSKVEGVDLQRMDRLCNNVYDDNMLRVDIWNRNVNWEKLLLALDKLPRIVKCLEINFYWDKTHGQENAKIVEILHKMPVCTDSASIVFNNGWEYHQHTFKSTVISMFPSIEIS